MDNGKWTMDNAAKFGGVRRDRPLGGPQDAVKRTVEDAGPYIGKEKRMKQKRKCRNCAWELVNDEQVLQSWLVETLGAEFRYNWSVRDALGREEPAVMHPVQYASWLEKGPCRGCPCEAWCNRVCALRARWWDARMDRLKKRLGVY